MNSKNSHIYKTYVLKIKKKKEKPYKGTSIGEVLGSKYNKIILFQLINTSFRIHKNNTLKKKIIQHHR